MKKAQMMTVKMFDRLGPEDFKNGAVQDEIRKILKIYEQLILRVPKGAYCHSTAEWRGETKVCSFWGMIPRDVDHWTGCCSFLDHRDDEPGGNGLLYMGVKECGINE